GAADRGRITGVSSTASPGDCTRGRPGATSPIATVLGRRFTVASGAGPVTARGPGSSRTGSKTGSGAARWAASCGSSMPPPPRPAGPRAGRRKDPDPIPVLGGPPPAQLEGPHDHAPGYSRGGFRTKVNLRVTDRGVVLGISVTPGQRHESRAFKPLMRRVWVSRRRGVPFWPAKPAGDRGYSDPQIRRWSRQHHIEPVIPTRKDQPREESFDRA